MPAPCMSVELQPRKWRQAGKIAIPNLILQEEGKLKMTRKDSDMLKVDERLRLARERREENLRQLALRERGWLAREERARRYYEKHLEERRRKLEDQRQREERRRMAVEEKRKQRLKEEKERFESVVQKTMAKSQKTKPKTAQSPRGAYGGKNHINAKRRSLSQWEINLVSRLQTPTIACLARSRSAVCLSQSKVSCHSMSHATAQKSGLSPATSTYRNVIRPGVIRGKHQSSNEELGSHGNHQNKLQSLTDTARIISTSERVKQNKPMSLLTGLPVRQMSPRQECLPALTEEEDFKPEFIHSSHQPQQCEAAPSSIDEIGCKEPVLKNNNSTGSLVSPVSPSTAIEQNGRSAGVQCRPQAGTTDPVKASSLLAEKRRQARLQREREEKERWLKEETEREREVLSCQKAEEQVKQEAETLRLQEQKRMNEEKQNENAQQQENEKRKLQQQREEEEAQAQVAEQQRIERESRFQREETERQERKKVNQLRMSAVEYTESRSAKRLEEIMKRTRKTDAAEKKPVTSDIIINDSLPNEILMPIHSLPLKEMIRMPGTTSVSKMGLADEGDILPSVAFKERRSIRTITGLEEIQNHQRAEVI